VCTNPQSPESVLSTLSVSRDRIHSYTENHNGIWVKPKILSQSFLLEHHIFNTWQYCSVYILHLTYFFKYTRMVRKTGYNSSKSHSHLVEPKQPQLESQHSNHQRTIVPQVWSKGRSTGAYSKVRKIGEGATGNNLFWICPNPKCEMIYLCPPVKCKCGYEDSNNLKNLLDYLLPK
jgi:hypothetical protein